MTGAASVSVVIVSRDRPEALRRCLIGVGQMTYGQFEVVVVADHASCIALRTLPQAAHVKLVEFAEANLSAARNAGIAAAAGEIVAFIDDDAVPEPTWLTYLAAPFADPAVMAAGGFVRGRNGISWQSRARAVDREGRKTPLEVPPNRAVLPEPGPGRAVKTEGTNMAVRRACLAALGGFDPRYRFFLDETDLNLRLMAAGHRTAIAPLAEVHHGFAASDRRRHDRAPTDLRQIGASWAVFLALHCPEDRQGAAWARIQADERRRALRHMVAGRLEPRDVKRLLRGLREGFAEGADRTQPPRPQLSGPSQPFRPYPSRRGARPVLIAGRLWSRARQRRHARHEVAAGNVVTVMRFSHTGLFHRVAFSPEGYWEHIGGLFGRSERGQRLFRISTFAGRVHAEADRVRLVRGLDESVGIKRGLL
ncbi:MAG: glycosyltransferase [Rhodobacteraceae bacterium]|nr:glycosyltransferase [Paracoccaceae bacterium]